MSSNKFLDFTSLFRRKVFLTGSAVLAVTTILSYVLGLFRDRLLVTTYGASSTLDAYNAAFLIPDLILNIFVAGALSAAFVPIFTELSSNQEKKVNESKFVNSVLNGSILVILIVGIVVLIFAPALSKLIVPGFDVFARNQYINLTRILLLAPLIFAVSNTLGSILVSKQKFFWYGLSAVLYNAGIILGIIYLSPRFGIYGAVIGAVVGAILHLISRLIGLINYKIKYKIKISFDEHFKTFLKLMTPKMIGHPLEQLTFLGYTAIASSLGAGSIVVMNLARNFQSAPVAIIGINVALASFSVLSQSAARNDRREFVAELKFAMKMIFLITSLSAIGILLIKNFLISVLLGGGAFDDAAISATASALGIFTIAIPTESLNHILSRAFYSLKNSATPVIIGLTGMFLAICTGYLFSRDMGVNGLILGFVLGSVFKLILLFLFLKREIRIKL